MKMLLSLGLLATLPAGANVCVQDFDKEVEPVIQQMSDRTSPLRWTNYEAFLKKFGPCLDGEPAETVQGISEEALAEDWRGFNDYVAKHRPERRVMKHIESGFSRSMGSPTKLKKIQANAKGLCERTLKSFCRRITSAKL